MAFQVKWSYGHVFNNVTIAAMVAAGVGVAVSWAMMSSFRRRRAKADWIEKTGIVLGVILIFALPFYLWDSLLKY